MYRACSSTSALGQGEIGPFPTIPTPYILIKVFFVTNTDNLLAIYRKKAASAIPVWKIVGSFPEDLRRFGERDDGGDYNADVDDNDDAVAGSELLHHATKGFLPFLM